MCLELLVWVGGGLLKRFLDFFGNEPSLGQKSVILHLPPFAIAVCINGKHTGGVPSISVSKNVDIFLSFYY